MIIKVCSGCKAFLGEEAPEEDNYVSHGFCESCFEKLYPEQFGKREEYSQVVCLFCEKIIKIKDDKNPFDSFVRIGTDSYAHPTCSVSPEENEG